MTPYAPFLKPSRRPLHARPVPRAVVVCRGVSLIEVLVSILLVTLGVLGASAMQTVALRNNQSSYEGTQSTILMQGLLDAMRANPKGVAAGSYNTGGWQCTAPTGATLHTSDLARWGNGLRDQINPSACGQVVCTTGACTISVRWDDSRGTAGSATKTVTTLVQL
jgi:type IV pilus assembly protein PilV